MDSIRRTELGVNFENIPQGMSVLINKDDVELENTKKYFQFALNSDIANNEDDILVYIADFDKTNQTVKPLMASTFDENGIFRKNLIAVYPPIYRKDKSNLLKIINE